MSDQPKKYIVFCSQAGDIGWLGVFSSLEEAREIAEEWPSQFPKSDDEVLTWVTEALFVYEPAAQVPA